MRRHCLNKTFFDVAETDSFAVGVLYRDDDGFRISSVLLAENAGSIRNKYDLEDIESSGTPESRRILELITGIVYGKNDSTPVISYLDLEKLTPFSKNILSVLAKEVTRGKVITYSGLAHLAGAGNSARAVGAAMRGNPFPVVFPCHRVIGADMSLHGYACGLGLKETLLRLEGVPVSDGCVDCSFAKKF